MRCRKAREWISRSVDGELEARRAARLGRHFAGCDDCRAFAEDMRKILGEAPGLAAPEPSDRVWRGIRAGLEAAGRPRLSAEGARIDRRPLFGPGPATLRYAGAVALALALVASGIVVGGRLGRRDAREARMTPEAREAYTLAKLDEAEGHYEQAIRSLGEAFAAGKGALPPEVAELFERNLAVIDATIQACRAAVLDGPDDLEARNYLMAAYAKKVGLLDSALDLQRRDRGPAGAGAVI
ncbi:MAG TPA: zf-HC2 domain-containing protein [Candidatus Aminicenantes bacterium]|nr:zf-HC2 domain-containing protein [Candidatus Aminicenantes bacterium]